MKRVWSFDDVIISDERVQALAHQFERFIHILCLEEDKRFLGPLIQSLAAHTKQISGHMHKQSFTDGEQVFVKGNDSSPGTLENGDNNANGFQISGPSLPRPHVEKKIIQGLCNILGLPAVFIDLGSSFVAQGGDSIHAMRLMASLKAEKISLPVHKIMQPHTLSSLVSQAAPMKANGASKVSPTLSNGTILISSSDQITDHLSETLSPLITNGYHNASEVVSAIRPCTPTQRQILRSQKLNWQSYKTHTLFDVTTNGVTPSALETAWAQIVSRHEILRTIFVPKTSGSEEFQIILRHLAPLIRQRPTGPKGSCETLSKIAILKSSALQAPHCFTICVHNNEAVAFRLDIDHILMDGPSHSLVVHEMNELLHGRNLSPPMSLGPLLDHQRAMKTGESLQYWQQYFKSTIPCRLRGLPPNAPTMDFHTLSFSLEDTDNIAKFCRKLQVTSSTLIRLVWALVLRDMSYSANISFGYLVSSRDAEFDSVDQVMGPMFHVLPCSFQIKGGATAHDALRDMQKDSVNGLAHQMISLPEVCESMGKDICGKDYFSTLINHRRFDVKGERGSGEGERLLMDLGTTDPMDVSHVYKNCIDLARLTWASSINWCLLSMRVCGFFSLI